MSYPKASLMSHGTLYSLDPLCSLYNYIVGLTEKFTPNIQSHSSTLTDDEVRDAHSEENGIEKIIRAVYLQKVGCFG